MKNEKYWKALERQDPTTTYIEAVTQHGLNPEVVFKGLPELLVDSQRALWQHTGMPFFGRLLLFAINRARHYLTKCASSPQNDELVDLILRQNAYIIKQLMVQCLPVAPREAGAIIHTLLIEYPALIMILHFHTGTGKVREHLPYTEDSVALAVEHIPALYVLVDRAGELMAGSWMGRLLVACLCCKYPVPRTMEVGERLFALMTGCTDMILVNAVVKRLLIAFPPMAQRLPSLELMQSEDPAVRESFSGITALLSELADQVKRPFYRLKYSALI